MNINEIAFEQIKDNYYWGSYGPFKVIINISNGYINATHLCKLAEKDHGKSRKFNNWSRMESSTEIMNHIVSLTLYSVSSLLIHANDVPNELRGTYAHPDLIPHISSWASPKFAVLVSKIVNAHIVREYKESIRIKDQTIDRLELKIDNQTKQINELLSEIKAARDENGHIIQQLDTVTNELENASVSNEELNEKVTEAHQTITKIATKLDIATDQRVPPAKQTTYNEVFAVYRNPNNNKFYMIRRQKRTVKTAISNCERSGYTERIYYSDSPNSVNLGIRIKDVLPVDLGKVSGTIITLASGKNTIDLINYIERSEREKKDI